MGYLEVKQMIVTLFNLTHAYSYQCADAMRKLHRTIIRNKIKNRHHNNPRSLPSGTT